MAEDGEAEEAESCVEAVGMDESAGVEGAAWTAMEWGLSHLWTRSSEEFKSESC